MSNRNLPIILLDLDNTILDFDKAEQTAASQTFINFGIEPSPELISRYNKINIEQWERLERGEVTRRQVLVGRFQILFEELGVERDCEAVQEMYEGLLSRGHWFMPGGEELLKALYGKHRMFLCSNGTERVQTGRLASSGIGPYFEKIFVSETMGANKPSPDYFRACFKEISDFDLSRTIMIGDSMTSDILGGKNAGVMTCWYNPQGKENRYPFSADYQVAELSEIPALLERIFG